MVQVIILFKLRTFIFVQLIMEGLSLAKDVNHKSLHASAYYNISHKEVGFAPNPSLNKMAVVIINTKKPITIAI